MNMATSIIRPQGALGAIAMMVSLLLFIVAGLCGYCYASDNAWLASVSRDLTKDAKASDERVIALLDWVYKGLGTRKNGGYFIYPAVGPTPVQVMRHGGDCADKARLLCAMLKEVNIAATPVMCFDKESGKPSHTMVEARLANGEFMVADPAYNLYFPQDDGEGYFDLLDLRHDPGIVARRVDSIMARRQSIREEDRYYLRAHAGYHGASTFNWRKGAMSVLLHDMLLKRMGKDVYRLRRPDIVERPKLLAAWTFVFAAIGLQFLAIVMRSLIRRRTRLRTPPTVMPSRTRNAYSSQASTATVS